MRGNAGFSDVKTLTVRCWDFRTIRLIFMNKPQYLHSFYMPPDPGSMQSSPDSILASLQPSSQECTSIGSEGEGADGEFVSLYSDTTVLLVNITGCFWLLFP